MSDRIIIMKDILSSELWLNGKFDEAHAYVDLAFLAYMGPNTAKVRNSYTTVSDGYATVSLRDLASRWHWGVNTVRRFLIRLKKQGLVDFSENRKESAIKVASSFFASLSDTRTDTRTDTRNGTRTDTRKRGAKSGKNQSISSTATLKSGTRTDTRNDTRTDTRTDTSLTLFPERKIKTSQQSKRPTLKDTFTERRDAFYNSLVPYVQKYGRGMIREFYDYWSEPNPAGTKMRWEMEKTWLTSGRLATWKRNDDRRNTKIQTQYERDKQSQQQWLDESENVLREILDGNV